MLNIENQNETTDRTNAVLENIPKTINTESAQIVHDLAEENLPVQREKVNYEVVFFIRYNYAPRPSVDEITNLFNKYGVVHHVNCPENKNFAFVFMSSLSTMVEHRRTRTTIRQIIDDMTPETHFHITVASSNRGPQQWRPRSNYYQNNNYQNNNYQRNPGYVRQNSYIINQQDNNGQRFVRYNKYNKPDNRIPYVKSNDENIDSMAYQQRRPIQGSYRTNEVSFIKNTEKQNIRRLPFVGSTSTSNSTHPNQRLPNQRFQRTK